MLWIILGAVIGLVFGIKIAIDNYCDFWEGVGYAVMGIILGVAIGTMVMILSSIVTDCCAEKTYYTVQDTDIHALQDNLATEGNFFLGSGHVNEELKYFYVKETDAGYTICNIDADKAYIQYTSDRCHLVRQSYTYNNWFVSLIAIPFQDRYIFYIPEGSIVTNYSIDLK